MTKVDFLLKRCLNRQMILLLEDIYEQTEGVLFRTPIRQPGHILPSQQKNLIMLDSKYASLNALGLPFSDINERIRFDRESENIYSLFKEF